MITTFLMHHGILGQKWGIRRFQNTDGTLTEEGKKRYYNSDGSLSDEGRKRASNAQEWSESSIGYVTPNGKDYGFEGNDRAEQIISLAADKAVKTLKRIEYLNSVVSNSDANVSFKQRYAMSKDAEKLEREYIAQIKKVTDAILTSTGQTRLHDFQNGDLSVYEHQTHQLLQLVGNQRKKLADRYGIS